MSDPRPPAGASGQSHQSRETPSGLGGTPQPGTGVGRFANRARLEAERYGPDAWIFVRELLQNSRDAGARTVAFTVREEHGKSIIVCRDDGDGMSFEHARRYLFALYASSKENDDKQAGKFGVGFWSILRFEPTAITIRSAPRAGPGWGLCLEGSLQHATEAPPLEGHGVEITLERPSDNGGLEHRVIDAVAQNARFVTCRQHPERPLVVTVNGKPQNAAFSLPAPSASFRRGSLRGVVALGSAPRVELFSRGLRIRSAASLDDLLSPSGRHTTRARVHFPELPDGLAPQAILESDHLEVMLSRSDAKENRALTRLIRLAEQELERLIDRQLAQSHPLPWWRRAPSWLLSRLRYSLLWRLALGSSLGMISALAVVWLLWSPVQGTTTSAPAVERAALSAPSPDAVAVAGAPAPKARAYADLGARYKGPRVDVLSPEGAEPLDLQYRPSNEPLHFAALLLARFDHEGTPVDEVLASELPPYQGVGCDESCVAIRYSVGGALGYMRLLVPTGHRVAHGSVYMNGSPMPVFATPQGHAVIRVGVGTAGTLHYQTRAAPDPRERPSHKGRSPLPPELRRYASRLAHRTVAGKVEALIAKTRELVAYDRSEATALRHAEAVRLGQRFIERTLAIGAGDCDIQNGLLVALLQAARVPARVAVGYLGDDGRVHPWLHAWVEYRDERGVWRVADASEVTDDAAVPEVATIGTSPWTLPTEPRPRTPVAAPPSETAHGAEPAAATETEAVADATRTDERAEAVVRAMRQVFTSPYAGFGLVGLMIALLAGGRTRRHVHLDRGADLSRLLRGMLHQPAAFSSVSGLYYRPIVPMVGGSRISLAKARELAIVGQLYRTGAQTLLAQRAAGNGARVLDASIAESRVVADALGAVDLDRWHALIARATEDPAIAEANLVLRDLHEDGVIRVSSGVPGGLAVLDLRPLRVRINGLRHRRLIVIDEDIPWMRSARAIAKVAPAAAAVVLLEQLLETLQIDDRRRHQVLAEAAKRALLDSTR